MSIAYIVTSCRGQVAALVSFSVQVSKLHKRTELPTSLTNLSSRGSRDDEIFASRRQRDSTQVSEYLRPEPFHVFVVQHIKDGWKALKQVQSQSKDHEQ
jgi:hypothetical protein